MRQLIIAITIGVLLLTGCANTKQIQEITPTLTTYTDEINKITFSYPQEWGAINENNFFYNVVKIDDLSEEKNIPLWEGEPISAKEKATREKTMLETALTTDLGLTTEDPITWKVDRTIITIAENTPALLQTQFSDDGEEYAEQILRFYKNELQITIKKTIPVTKTGTTVTEIFNNFSIDTQSPAVQKITAAFAEMVQTITFF